MLITLNSAGGIASRSQQYLLGSYNVLRTFTKVCEFLKGDLEANYQTSEAKDMGLSLEQDALMQMEELVQELNIGELENMMLQGYFGSGLCTKKYVSAVKALAEYQELILQKADAIFAPADNDMPFSLKELRMLGKRISFAVGDLIYAMSNIVFNPVDARWVLENQDEEITYDSALQHFFHSIKMQPKEFAAILISLQHSYISVIPIYEDNPEAWEQITSQLHPSLVDTLTDYGVYITSLDVRAVKKGILTIDENYLDTLNNRAENDSYIANEDPEGWASFLELVPDKYIETFLDIDSFLTPGLLEPALQDNKISDSYVAWLLKFLKGEPNGETKFFNNN